MIPIAPTIFWGPMAYAIMGGLAVATLLTLVFLPALYVAWFRIKRPRPDDNQIINIESLPETHLGDRRDGAANAAIPQLETTAHI
jgi:multidrug efflux pump